MTPTLLDTKGLNCPLPVLRAKKIFKDVPPGGLLQVLATDPGAIRDFAAFCKATGSTLVEQTEAGGVLTFLIRKAG